MLPADVTASTGDGMSADNLRGRITAWLARPTKPTASADIPELSCAIGTATGDVRTDNQDRAILARFLPALPGRQSFVLAAVCDGMGGMAEGAKCAEIALAAVVTRLMRSEEQNLSDRLRNAIELANREVYREFRARGGTTIAAVAFSGRQAVGASAGDSRIYTYRKGEKLRQISVDDTIAGELSRMKGEDAPQLDLESFSQHLAQYVGMGDNLEVRLYPLVDAPSGSTYLLTSDGAHSAPASVLEAIVVHAPSAHIAIGRLVHLASWCGGKDNATVISFAAERGQPKGEPGLLELWDSYSKIEFPLAAQLAAPELRPVTAAPEKPSRTKRGQDSPNKPRSPRQKRPPADRDRNQTES